MTAMNLTPAADVAWYFEVLEPGDVFDLDEYHMATVVDVDVNRDRVTYRDVRFDRDWNPIQELIQNCDRDVFADLFKSAGYTSAEEMRIMDADARAEFAS